MSTIISPPLLAGEPKEQLRQMNSYLYQLSEALNVALNEVNRTVEATVTEGVKSASSSASESVKSDYAALRDLIIKTADSVTVMRDEITSTLTSEYVAISDYGTYYESIRTNVIETAESVLTEYNFNALIADLSDSISDINGWAAHLEGYIRQGIIGEDEDGLPIIGIAIGQNLRTLGTQTVDGIEYDILDETQSCAFYTSTGISFRLGGREVAYLTNEKELVTELEVSNTITLGNWLISHANGFTIKWIGGDS